MLGSTHTKVLTDSLNERLWERHDGFDLQRVSDNDHAARPKDRPNSGLWRRLASFVEQQPSQRAGPKVAEHLLYRRKGGRNDRDNQ